MKVFEQSALIIFMLIFDYMTEAGFTPEGLARTVAGREIGAKRLDPVIGRLEKLTQRYVERENHKTGLQIRDENPPIDSRKKDKKTPNLSFSDLRRQEAEEIGKRTAQAYGGEVQGKYESKIKKAKTSIEKERVQKDFEEEFDPRDPIKKESYGYTDAYGKRQHATPIETIHGLATVENKLFDNIRGQMAKSGEIKNPQHLTQEEQQKIQEAIDKKVRNIGMTLLRGMAIPNPYGQVFVDKAIIDSRKLIEQTNK